MTDYSALRAATVTLRALLKRHITDSLEADLATVAIDLRSPAELDKDNITTAVSLWLYRVTVQPDLYNAPLRRPADDAIAHRSLPLDLSYLITALHPEPKARLSLTGRVLQVVNDHVRLRGSDLEETMAGTDAELRLSIETTTLSEDSNLWYTLQAPFRLAVPVRMQVVDIASHLPPIPTSPVLTRRLDVAQAEA
ncbi:DUF4255 domain-containing protein [Solirubrobacter soli]|uniref:DUF4255 domain-containing protein n=1 Tax=Solirubrobacter soli TaxID=363832 RepID=UPI00041A7E99|nr:DUF4255 domain-containing protein [Solirubrobacter soli]